MFVARATDDDSVVRELAAISQRLPALDFIAIPVRPYWKLLAWWAIRRCDVFVLVSTPRSRASDSCAWELRMAVRYGRPRLIVDERELPGLAELLSRQLG